MLATARHMKEDIDGYWEPDHPVQKRIRTVLEDVAGSPLPAHVCGVDGCSVPNYAMPAQNLAIAFARLFTGESLSLGRHAAAQTMLQAAWAEPELAAGIGRLDTIVLSSFKGAVYVKTGAEGVYAGVFPHLKLGFALKIDDGASRAADAVTRLLVEAYVPAARGKFPLKTLKNAQSKDVGLVRASQILAVALS